MKRHFSKLCLLGAIFTVLALVGWADVVAASSPDKSSTKDQVKTVKIVLHPAPAPTPALKYQLLPPFIERRPGNAVVHYLKVPHEQWYLYTHDEFWDAIYKCAKTPLPELRKEKDTAKGKLYSWVADDGSWMIGEIERGARCESCDWQLPIRDHEFYSILLPAIQSSRSLGRILKARARLQMADGRYDDAIHSLQTGYSLGRHVAQGPCFVQCLVGTTIASDMSAQVETFIQQPDSPNLYWALSFLPQPLIDFRPAYEAEMAALKLTFPELRDLDGKDYSPQQWRRLLERTVDILHELKFHSQPLSSSVNRLRTLASVIEGYPQAKRFLIAEGRSAAEVEAMPVAKVILLYSMRTHEELRDDLFKSVMLPYPEAIKWIDQAECNFHGGGREKIPITADFLPAVRAVKIAEARSQRSIAALRVLEALRIYAAAHDGRLPETLDDVREVPIPLDPMRGKPFVYSRQDATHATLESPDAILIPVYPLRYQIELVSKGARQ